VLGLSNFLTFQTFRARQNLLFRTNRTLYMQPASFSGLPRRKRSRVYAPNAATRFVAQGAALFAGPEALLRSGTRSCRRTAIRECFERSETVARVAPAMISGQRDLRLLSCEDAHFVALLSPLEYALTLKRGEGGTSIKADPSGKNSALVMTALGRDDCALTAVGERVV